jgi:uncharacterized protein YbbK (DUF523 family)
MPRTTLRLEEDALKVAKMHASRHRVSLGEAVSELVRQAADRLLVTETRNGLHVVRLSRRSPKVASALVEKLSDDLRMTSSRDSYLTLSGQRHLLLICSQTLTRERQALLICTSDAQM